jgi:hypothetical protein
MPSESSTIVDVGTLTPAENAANAIRESTGA